MYDIIIAGAGAAGLSAAVYAMRAGYKTVVVEGGMYGGQIVSSHNVDNYLGLPDINGAELADKFYNHAKKTGVEFVFSHIERAECVNGEKMLYLSNGTEIKGRALIIACGCGYRRLTAVGAARFEGRGISYCATCDGAFYKDKVVAVVGGGNSAFQAALYLKKLCKKVYLLHRNDNFKSTRTNQQAVSDSETIEVMPFTVVREVFGDELVQGVVVENTQTRQQQRISADGVFVAVGRVPQSQVFSHFVECDKNGYIIADESCRTSCEGVCVAGDIRTKGTRQLITAAADGAAAVYNLQGYL